MDDEMTRLFLSTMVIPSWRQNIDGILRRNGLEFYRECLMLKIKLQCVVDGAFVEFVKEVE